MNLRRVQGALAALGVTAALPATAIAGSTDAGGSTFAEAVFPDDEWATADAGELGFDTAVLDELVVAAGANGADCFVVVRHGYLVAEWYWNDTGPDSVREVFSVTKSIASTLVGIAAAAGALEIDDPASDYVAEWADTPSADVTIRNLISNDSGREWSLVVDYGELVGAADRSAYAIGLGQEFEPGTAWSYNNSAIQVLSEVLEEATGIEPADYAAGELFTPIGMADSEMTTDAAGNTLTFTGLQSGCLDLARFGLLFLNDGTWDGTEVLPAAWVAEATAPAQDIAANNGFLWWLNEPGPIGDPSIAVRLGGTEASNSLIDGQMAPGAPDDLYWALGLGNQVVQVHPGTDTVVVRVGDIDGEFNHTDTARVVTDAITD